MVVVLALRLTAGVMGANPPTDTLIVKGGALDRAKLVAFVHFQKFGVILAKNAKVARQFGV